MAVCVLQIYRRLPLIRGSHDLRRKYQMYLSDAESSGTKGTFSLFKTTIARQILGVACSTWILVSTALAQMTASVTVTMTMLPSSSNFVIASDLHRLGHRNGERTARAVWAWKLPSAYSTTYRPIRRSNKSSPWFSRWASRSCAWPIGRLLPIPPHTLTLTPLAKSAQQDRNSHQLSLNS